MSKRSMSWQKYPESVSAGNGWKDVQKMLSSRMLYSPHENTGAPVRKCGRSLGHVRSTQHQPCPAPPPLTVGFLCTK
eukprot:1092983-Rhodomonas_salina.1